MNIRSGVGRIRNTQNNYKCNLPADGEPSGGVVWRKIINIALEGERKQGTETGRYLNGGIPHEDSLELSIYPGGGFMQTGIGSGP